MLYAHPRMEPAQAWDGVGTKKPDAIKYLFCFFVIKKYLVQGLTGSEQVLGNLPRSFFVLILFFI